MATRSPLAVRPPAVAGTFYPGRREPLRATVDADLATIEVPAGAWQPKALIVPHAGYIYSGPVAASAYARLRPWRDRIDRVVLLGPAHRVAVRSMAVSSADAWSTPLGEVPIDRDARARISGLPGVIVDDRPHAPEHSLEVQVPFLQRLLREGFTLVPIVVGHAEPAEVAAVLDALWGGDETLIVISSDLSHYNDYRTAQALDRATATAIVTGAIDAIGPQDACGAFPVRGMLEAAKHHHLDIKLIDLRNSGDTAGPTDRVVGYGAFVLTPHGPPEHRTAHEVAARDLEPGPGELAGGGDDSEDGDFSAEERAAMLNVAEEAIRARLEHRAPHLDRIAANLPPALTRDGAAFVTLRDGGRLLGCIGSMTPSRPLIDDIADNAVGAAFRDPRMPPLSPEEFATMSIHISVLTPVEPMAVSRIAELRDALRPGVDGLLIEAGRNRGTFLPSVWEQLGDRDEFLAHLWMKAGLRPDSWPRGMQVWRYRTVEFGDEGPRRPIDP